MCKTFKNTFLGKCDVINMLIKLGSLDKSVISGNTFLLRIGEENSKNRYVYVGANKRQSFISNDHILENNSNMEKNMIPYSITIGEEKIYILSPRYKCKKKKKYYRR